MKKRILKAFLTVLIFSLVLPAKSFAETPKASDYSTGNLTADASVAQAGIRYTPVPDSGLPAETVATRIPYSNDYSYTYTGRKKIALDYKTPGVNLRAVSDSKKLSAWIWENYLTVENNGLTPGESAYVTITATRKDYDQVSQKIKITLTDGSAAYPHIVTTIDDLKSIDTTGLGKNYKQAADIDLNRIEEWTPIGSDTAPFTGTYNGNGRKITNVSFKNIPSDYPALFGTVSGEKAKISEINLSGRLEPYYYNAAMGTIVGKLDAGSVTGCSFKGDIVLKSSAKTVGGIVAAVYSNGTIENCSFDGKIITKAVDYSFVGGIAGILDGSINNCVFNGEISVEGKKSSVGGITGQNNGTIKNSVVTADLSKYGAGDSDSSNGNLGGLGSGLVGSLGGIAGENESEIFDSAYMGKLYVKGNKNNAGGIAGNNTGSISGCSMKGAVSLFGDSSYVGGILGSNLNGSVQNTTAAADISGDGLQVSVGGIAGENASLIDITNMNSGSALLAAIESCAFSGAVKSTGTGSVTGGIAGRNIGMTNVSTDTASRPVTARSTVEKCVLTAGKIEGPTAGRIVAENKLETVGYKDSATQIHFVSLSNNAALDSVTVNGAAVQSGTKADSINGASLTEGDIKNILISNGISPQAAQIIK